MPEPTFTDSDFENPDAPEGQRRIRKDHIEVRDLSYDQGRGRQYEDLMKGAFFDLDFDDHEPEQPLLQLFIKERPRGRGYVADFVYRNAAFPFWVYGTLVNDGAGLVVNELELWRPIHANWEYRDPWGHYVGPDGDHEADDQARPHRGVTAADLRRIPLGEIVAGAQRKLANATWLDEGVHHIPWTGPVPFDDLNDVERAALERSRDGADEPRRGRPPLSDELLREVAHAYLDEAPDGRGLTARLARRFDRPEPTVRDWVAAARARGFLTKAQPGRRGAGPGPRLMAERATAPSTGEDGSH